MISIKFNLLQIRRRVVSGLLLGVWFAWFLVMPGMAHSAPVAVETARRVAEGQLRQHLALYGHWNHHANPTLGEAQQVHFDDHAVAFHFDVLPSGHILVAVDDFLSPVLLYSDRSSFDPGRAGFGGSVESWIIPELSHRLGTYRSRGAAVTGERAGVKSNRGIQAAWERYTSSTEDVDVANEVPDTLSMVRGADVQIVGPLLTSSWGQDSPYNENELMPDASCGSGPPLTGCVATAWAQLLRYWRWPYKGSGVHQYDWEGQTLSLDYDSAAPYEWGDMPGMLTAGSPPAQIDAVTQLLYHTAIAAETDFGCNASVSIRFADEVLDTYFNYRSDMQVYDRAVVNLDDLWFAYFRNELDADPPRPVVLSIWGSAGGHEVIADGYQSGATDLVHINFGWDGNYNGFYNVTDDFSTGGIDWDANFQIIVTGIEPNNQPPKIINMGPDQRVGEGLQVHLSGDATDPELMGDITYQWTQTAGTSVVLANADSTTPTFTAPQVHAETRLVFQLRATDYNRAYSLDTVEVTVENTDGSVQPDSRSNGSADGGSGCFMGSLWLAW